jgi:metal-sulfur cluster biosynthetic enzyme
MPKNTKKNKALWTLKQYKQLLNQVPDPELGVGIVDLGLIYDVKELKNGLIKVLMTLTSMGCPMGPQIGESIESILLDQKHIKEVHVEIVWEPAWNPSMMDANVRTILYGNPKKAH